MTASHLSPLASRTIMIMAGGTGGHIFPALSLAENLRAQGWNIVYLPYCTGDVHTGSAVVSYADSNPAQPRVQYHRGWGHR